MQERIIAKRYARALLNIARLKGILEPVKEDLAGLNRLYQASKQFSRVLNHPLISRERKKNFLTRIVGEKIQPVTFKFIELLIKKNRFECLPEIKEAYDFLSDRDRGIMRVKVKSFYPLKNSEQELLRAKLARLSGKEIILEVHQETGIMGGLALQIGDDVIDGTAAHRLNQIKELLLRKTI
ncbi:MAG: ATP synthase F1 subunit delta [Planctomycetota bacterium]